MALGPEGRPGSVSPQGCPHIPRPPQRCPTLPIYPGVPLPPDGAKAREGGGWCPPRVSGQHQSLFRARGSYSHLLLLLLLFVEKNRQWRQPEGHWLGPRETCHLQDMWLWACPLPFLVKHLLASMRV